MSVPQATTTADLLLSLAAAALSNQTDAGARVYTPGDWPTAGPYPVLLLRVSDEDCESLGRSGAPQFTATATLQVIGRVQAPAGKATGMGGGLAAEKAAYALKRQVEIALINNPALMGRLQQFAFMRTKFSASAEGEQHEAEVVVTLGLEFYRGPEDFYPVAGQALTELTLATQYPTEFGPPLGLDITLPQ